MTVFFWIFAALIADSALLAVTRRNAVASALWAAVAFVGIAGQFVLLSAYFLAVVEVLVYAGAIMVLFLFVIMLLNLGEDYQGDLRGGIWAVLAFMASGALAGFLARRFTGADGEIGAGEVARALDVALAEQGAIGVIARPLFTDYVVPFEISSILFLSAMVGAVVIGKKE